MADSKCRSRPRLAKQHSPVSDAVECPHLIEVMEARGDGVAVQSRLERGRQLQVLLSAVHEGARPAQKVRHVRIVGCHVVERLPPNTRDKANRPFRPRGLPTVVLLLIHLLHHSSSTSVLLHRGRTCSGPEGRPSTPSHLDTSVTGRWSHPRITAR
jgi:hypothetical protein